MWTDFNNLVRFKDIGLPL